MLFSVVYGVTIHGDEILEQYLPRKSLRKYLDGGISENEYSYLGGGWEKGKCWSGAGILTRTQFDAFVDDCGLMSDDLETMGTIGGPLGFRVVPDISFRAEHFAAIVSCRVTPILNRTPKLMETGDERVWNRLRNAVVRHYSNGSNALYESEEYSKKCRRELREAARFWEHVNNPTQE